MPIYEYQCEKCNIKEEIMASINDAECNELICDNCLEPMKKLVSLSSFRLKGRGWAGATIKHGKNYYGEGLD